MNTQDIVNSLLSEKNSCAKVRDNRVKAQYQRNVQRREIQDLIEELSINEQE